MFNEYSNQMIQQQQTDYYTTIKRAYVCKKDNNITDEHSCGSCSAYLCNHQDCNRFHNNELHNYSTQINNTPICIDPQQHRVNKVGTITCEYCLYKICMHCYDFHVELAHKNTVIPHICDNVELHHYYNTPQGWHDCNLCTAKVCSDRHCAARHQREHNIENKLYLCIKSWKHHIMSVADFNFKKCEYCPNMVCQNDKCIIAHMNDHMQENSRVNYTCVISQSYTNGKITDDISMDVVGSFLPTKKSVYRKLF